MKKILQDIIRFFKTDIWKITRKDVSPIVYLLIIIVKKLILAINFFTTKRVVDSASALTYSTLLAIVPIFAVVFAIARGFGFSIYIENWFRNLLSSQPDAANTIIGFVNSYLVHTKSGIFLGVGLIFMLYTVLMLTRNIEQTFNSIWQVKQERSLLRTFTDYMAMFFMLPIIIILISGITIFMSSIMTRTHEYMLLGPMMKLAIDVMPFVFMSAVFIALYVFMPNTKVKLSSTIVPGILAGVAMQLLQLFYVDCQMFLSGYNAIYGSFAALPLFMLWVQISWTICLFGAELCYTNQNMEDFAFKTRTEDISHRYRMMMSAVLLSKICKRFAAGEKPYTALELKLETNIPVRVVNDLLYNLEIVNMVSENAKGKGSDDVTVFQPAQTLTNITVGTMMDSLEALGNWDLDIDVHTLTIGEHWKHVMESRHNYLNTLRTIQLKDL